MEFKPYRSCSTSNTVHRMQSMNTKTLPAHQTTRPTAATIQQVYTDNYRTKTFVLDMDLEAEPGQFVMAWLPRFDEKPFSLVNSSPLTLMITAVGPFTRLVHEKQVGDRLWIRGPFGNGFHVPETQKRIALVGGGYGVAPLLWLAETVQQRVDAVHAILGAGAGRDLLYVDRFQQQANPAAQSTNPEIAAALHHLHLTTEDGSQGHRGRVTDALEPLLQDEQIDGIYACGPHGMLHALEALAARHNVPCQLSWEAYMRCGIGICGACEHNGYVLCMDGPVLPSSVDSAI